MLRLHARLVLLTTMLFTVGLLAPSAAATAASASVDREPRSESHDQRHGDRGGPETQAAPVLWLVVVAVRAAGPKVIRVAARAATSRQAREVAKEIARNSGFDPVSTQAPIRGDYRTAGGFQIRVGQDPTRANGYGSFNAFKNRWGRAGDGREWHHIVEQKARQSNGALWPAWMLHNRQNLISIRTGLHQKCINALLSTKLKNLIKRDRDALRIRVVAANREQTLRFAQRGFSYNNQHLFGLRLLKHCGVAISGSGI